MIAQSAPIETWFGIGGGADRFCEPTDEQALLDAVRLDPGLRVLGDGANLLVDDQGVGELVVRLCGGLADWDIDDKIGIVRVGAGANLPKLIHATVRSGLAGIETLGGVPATIGGAIAMNAGGKFGEIATSVRSVRVLTRDARWVDLSPEELRFGYRECHLDGAIVVSATLGLQPGCDPTQLRATLKSIMGEKKRTQPLAASSCGCVFRNPTLADDHPELGDAGQRLSAGMLIDRAGAKGLVSDGGHVRVSEVHANFFETSPGARADEVIGLIGRVADLVGERFGITLRPELVIWRRGER